MRDSQVEAVRNIARKYNINLSGGSNSRINSCLRQSPPDIDAVVREFHSRSGLSDTDMRHAKEDLEKAIKP